MNVTRDYNSGYALLNASVVGQWSSIHDWFYFISNIAIWAACLILPIFIIIYLMKKGKDDHFFRGVYSMFALFLFVIGLSFLTDALIFFNILSELTIVARIISAVVSWILVVTAVSGLSTSLSMKTRRELMEEINKRMQIEYELKVRIERLLESERNVRLGYIYWDLVTDRVEMSDMAADVLGIRMQHAVTFNDIMAQLNPEQKEVVQDFLENKLLKAKNLTSYFRIQTADEVEERYVLMKAEVLRNSIGDPVNVKGSIQNVSELRELQRMEEQKKKLKEIAWVQSHRMRSPVATILGMSDLFNYDNPADPVNAEVLSNIKDLTHKLDDMIHEVDALTRSKEETH
jgi:PAS domain-containing protein